MLKNIRNFQTANYVQITENRSKTSRVFLDHAKIEANFEEGPLRVVTSVRDAATRTKIHYVLMDLTSKLLLKIFKTSVLNA